MPAPLPVTVTAGAEGPWRITAIAPPAGETLPAAERLVVEDGPAAPRNSAWRLRGVTSHLRYTAEAERATKEWTSVEREVEMRLARD
jgi:hypothetical protein